MKIESGRGVSSSGSVRRAGAGAAAPGFAPVGGADGAAPASSAASVNAITPLDAIMALQGDSGGARRARQVRRGKDALDALDDLRGALLSGASPARVRADLERLRGGLEETGERDLDGVLIEIETRLEVEMAKLEMAARAT